MSKLSDSTWDEKHHTEHQDHAAQHQRGQAAEPRAALVAAACNKQIIITAVNGTSRTFSMYKGFHDFSKIIGLQSNIISILYDCDARFIFSTTTIRHLRITHSSQCSTSCILWSLKQRDWLLQHECLPQWRVVKLLIKRFYDRGRGNSNCIFWQLTRDRMVYKKFHKTQYSQE